MTLLTIIESAADEIGLERPATVVSNSDPQVRQLLRAATQEGKYLAKAYNWEIIKKEGSVTTAAQESQGVMTTIASDFDRFANDTMWNRTSSEKIYGPLTDVQWQRVKADVTSGVTNWFRIRGGSLLFTPNPTASQTVKFEYYSKNWIDLGSGATPAAADGSGFNNDANTVVFDEELMTLGVTYRWLKGRGLDFQAVLMEYRERVELVKNQDGAKPNIDMGGVEYGYLGVNVPESAYGS
tara:strand:+ start:10677 stop:11393 length:717 start_codon:yes stop_codon:yes gene_type:complete